MGWDPIGVAGMPQAADEYDCLMGPPAADAPRGSTAVKDRTVADP
jgi:hypothetical protein